MTTEKRAHSLLGPSKSKRWMSCPGSIKLEEKCPPPRESAYAFEGTCAHTLGEACLKLGQDPGDFVGNTMEAEGKPFKVTRDMAEAVQVYVDAIRELAPEAEQDGLSKLLKVEERFDLSWLHPGIFGSCDACVYDVDAKRLHVVDYKHGQGVVVEPEWNSQLMMYGLGAMHSLWLSQTEKTRKSVTALDMVKSVELVIVQPRARGGEEPVKRWEIQATDLLYWGLHVLAPAARATEKEGARLAVGDHCRFCPALAICPEQVKNAIAVAQTDFETLHLPDPSSLSGTDIAKVIQASEILSAWADEVKSFARGRMELGMQVPGFKLVAGKTNRRWIDEDATADSLKLYLGEDVFTRKVISVAEAEKRLKSVGENPESCMEGLWEKPEGGLSIVPETDRRHAVIPQAAMDLLEHADFLS